MKTTDLEERISALEVELTRLKARVEGKTIEGNVWLDKVWGSFANDPDFEEAMRLGREYREAQQPKNRPKKIR